ncbi:MAG TPA: tagatose 1,6-diphosphate aldolase [Candidatus Acidoferrales bacterium]|nr:tagatose 1,6-diphosphate aldolase [Candidatus Acidoferrales bacterium]
MNTVISPGKRRRLDAAANQRGVIAAAAMDQRGSLESAIAREKGVDKRAVTPAMMTEFKQAVTSVLSPYASAILLDPEYGLGPATRRAKGCGLLLAYERSGYDNTRPGRQPDLLEHWSVRRLVEAGADCIKALLYYNPFDSGEINDPKHAWVERIGAECAAADAPFFLEFVGYDDSLDAKSLDYARRKPEIVRRSIAEFSKPAYAVDVLKVEIPVNLTFVKGARAAQGEPAYSREEAIGHFRAAAAEARKPFIYLSAGVSNEMFVESLELAAESGVPFSGVLCGRATWQNGVRVYAKQGTAALEDWLGREGVRNIQAVNQALATAKPWFGFYGAPSSAALAGPR